jgi:hypothetical protein
MKPTEAEMRLTLAGDSIELLVVTYNEYTDDTRTDFSKTLGRDELTDLIIEQMAKHGDIAPAASTVIKLSDVARELNVDPKVARDKMRRSAAAGKPMPSSLKTTGWVFDARDKAMVMDIIRPRKIIQQGQN